MKKSPKQKVILNNAYREISFIDENANKILHSYNGPKQFENLFPSTQKQQEGIEIEKQPLYFDEVDHNIEEVGIMTVKEVRYLTDEEWQLWMKGRENPFLSFDQQKPYKYESRHNLAVNRPRNEKGQFLSKPKQQPKEKAEKQRKIKKKRGRKPKTIIHQDNQQN